MKKYLLIFLLLFSAVSFAQWQPLSFTSTGGGDCDHVTMANEIFISDINDSPAGSYGAIEIYNPTNAPINLSNYSLRRRGDYGTGNWAWETGQAGFPNLSGSLPPGGIYLVMVGTNGSVCTNVTYNLSLGQNGGINGNDQIQLLKNGVTIDDVWLPTSPGFSLVRRADAEAPKAVFNGTAGNSPDWTRTGQNCGSLGNHTIDNTTPPEIDNISRYRDNPGTIPYEFCVTPTRVRVQMDTSGNGFSYSYNLQGTTTTLNTTNTTGIFSNLQADTYILTVTINRNSVFFCTHQVRFNIAAGVQTSPIILLN